jgi:type I restriction enzyme S subunit
VNIYHLGAERVRDLPTSFPDLSTQERVADLLDRETARIDATISAKTQLIELVRERWTTAVSWMIANRSWPEMRLKRLVIRPLEYGIGQPAEYDDPSWPRYIRTTDVTAEGAIREDTFKSLPPEVAGPYLLSDGDLLLTRSGATVGKSFLYRKEWGPACFAGYLIRVAIDRSKALPQFLSYFTQSEKYWSQIELLTIQATIQNVSAERYGDLVLQVPSVREQRRVVEELDATDARLSGLRKLLVNQVALLREHRQALITAAVTGQLDMSGKVGYSASK